MPGKTSAVLNIPIGKSSIEIEFSRGCLDQKNYRPATYQTSNPVVQAIIEGSQYFPVQIEIVKTILEPKDQEVTTKKEEAAVKPQGQEFEASTWEEVAAILKANGAKAIQMKTQSAAAKFAASKGLSFPNYTFED